MTWILHSAFVQDIARLGYSPSLLLLWTLANSGDVAATGWPQIYEWLKGIKVWVGTLLNFEKDRISCPTPIQADWMV